ncbi:MAG: helix-turn-helix domain-containing protein [Candidatus Cybelea sp.]|jgi:predicted ATPase/transcriptional regulator with XRE-family HTH domain
MERARRLDFGTLLRQCRLDAGLTQQTLAERANVSVEAIGALERGTRTRPYRETVALLSRALGLSPEREALLESAIDATRPPRQQVSVDGVSRSLLRIVCPDREGTPRHNLPRQLTSFVGRQRAVDAIAALLREHRLVTVVGAGGVGKTRIAVEIGSRLLDDCPDGVWLVDLAPLADQRLVASAVASALQLPSSTGSSLDAVVAYVKSRRLLLIFDNCEHLIAAVRDVASEIAQCCPHVRILATSRSGLEIAVEQVFRLPSLAVPPDSAKRALEGSLYEAVALFAERARAVDASFSLTDDNATDVADICRRLDGIPLAIELAAARAQVLAPRQIADRLNQCFRLLVSGDPAALPRHRTITALLDWSYDLLIPREQRFFESLSVFAGNFSLETMTSVCAIDGEDDLEVIDLAASLATKSLLVAELVGSEQRYRLLESSRQYASAKLLARGALDELTRRHAVTYVELAERLDRAWETTPDREWLPRVHLELENWRVALEWALGKQRDVVLGQRLCALRQVLWRCLPLPEARRWVAAAVEAVDELTPLDLVAPLEHAAAEAAAQFADRNVSLAAAERAIMRYRELGDVLGLAEAQRLAALSLAILGRPAEAAPLLKEALATARTLGKRRLLAQVLSATGLARSLAGAFDAAHGHLTEALGLAKILGADVLAGFITTSLASNELDAGHLEASHRLNLDALAIYRALNSPTVLPQIASVLSNITQDLVRFGRYDEARVHAEETLERAHELQLHVFTALALLHLVVIALLTSRIDGKRTSAQLANAARLMGFVQARFATFGVPEVYRLPQQRDRALAALREAVGTDELTQLMATGATMADDEAIAYAYALD